MCDIYDYDDINSNWGSLNYSEDSAALKLLEKRIYQEKEKLFEEIKNSVNKHYCDMDMSFMKTKDGETQKTERLSIKIIKSTLDEMGLVYECAGSQQSKDFRNVHRPDDPNISINIEIKKTDGTKICFNDTCPSIDIFYIIMFTGKKFKTKKEIPSKIIFINGYDLLKEDEENMNIYIREVIEPIKNDWGRKKIGEHAKKFKRFSVYPRPNIKADISDLLS